MDNMYFNKDVFNQKSYNQNIPNINYNSIPWEQSYIENLIRNNYGKKMLISMTFPYSNEIHQFSGILERSGRDYVILSDPSTGKWHLLPINNINYISFDENINYALNNWFFSSDLLYL